MTAPTLLLLAAAAAAVLLAATLSAAEAALPRIGRSRAREIVGTGDRGSRALAAVVADTPGALTVSTLTRVALDTFAVAAVLIAATAVTGSWWLALTIGWAVMLVVTYAFVGAAPRALGQRHPEATARATAPVLRVAMLLLGRPARVFTSAAAALVGGQASATGPFASEAELRDLLEQAEESAVIDREENLMAQRVLSLGSLSTREVMVPRTDMVTVARDTDLLDALDVFLRSGYSRLPVVGRDVDDIVGVCYVKDVAARLHPHPGRDADGSPVVGASTLETVRQVMRPVLFVPESKAADDLLRELQEASVHLAVVIDEYGGVAGLATIEDLLEEIVGPISDEYDQDVPEAEDLPDGGWRVSARMHLQALSELVGATVEDDDVDTVGGLLAKRLGQVPLPGTSARVDRLQLVADGRDARRNRLLSVIVRVTDPVSEAAPVPERAHV